MFSFLFCNEQVLFFPDWKIALLVAIITNRTVFCDVSVGEISKIKSLFAESPAVNIRFARHVEPCKDSPVFLYQIIDISHVIVFITIETIVIADTALIGTKFFIRSAFQRIAAFLAVFECY
jgi:hypothetical protein